MFYSKGSLFYLLVLVSIVSYAQEPELDTNTVNQTLTIALSNQSFPYHFLDDNNRPAGMLVDFWQLWAEKQNVSINFKHYNWQDSLEAVEQGQVDFHAGLMQVESRKGRFAYSESIFTQNSYIYLHRDMPMITSIDELSPYAIGVIEGSSQALSIIEKNKAIKLREFTDRNTQFDAALDNQIMAFAASNTLTQGYERIDAIREFYPKYRRLKYFEGQYSTAVSIGNKHLLQLINDGIAKISQEQKDAIYQKWTQMIRKSDALQLVFTSNLSPYMGVSPSGRAQGLFIDIWRLWSETTGIDVEFVPETMSGSIELVKQEEADVHLAYPEKNPSTTGLKIASHVYTSHSKIFVAKDAMSANSIEGLYGKRVGLFTTSPYLTQFKTSYPQITVREFASHGEMILAIEKGEIDAIISEVENMNVKLVNANLQSSFFILNDPVFNNNMYGLVNPNNPQLAKVISDGFKLLPLEKLKDIEQNWLTLKEHGYFNKQVKKLNLDAEEFDFLAKYQSFTVGIANDWAPVEFINENGQADGVNVDLIKLLAERAGFDVEFKVYESYANLFDAFNNEEVDIIAGLAENQERLKTIAYSQSYWDMPWGVLHSRFLATQQNINHFYGKRLALVKGYQLIGEIRLAHPQINITVVDSVEQGLAAVQQGLVDGFIDTLPVLSELAKRENIIPMAVSLVEEIPIESSKIAVLKKNKLLINILNKALLTIDSPTKQEIFDKWFDVNIKTGLDKRFVTKVAAQFGVLIFIIILVIAIWNRKLRQEIKLRKTLEDKMKHMATHDELTGVANRVLLKQQVSKAISMHQRQQLKLALLFIDLDGFKKINDSYGHDAGDQVLLQVARRLEQCIRNSDTVSRFGGDEFAILITGLNSKQGAAYIAEKIIKSISEPFVFKQGQANIGCSIGIAVYPEDGTEESELLNMADNLMYRVKTAGKNNYAMR